MLPKGRRPSGPSGLQASPKRPMQLSSNAEHPGRGHGRFDPADGDFFDGCVPNVRAVSPMSIIHGAR